jgi:hypothetical protein
METLKRWLGWGAPEEEQFEDAFAAPPSPPRPSAGACAGGRRAAAAAAAAAAAGRRPAAQPLLCDVPPGERGAAQGLEWYSASLRADADGFIAQEFLEEEEEGGRAATGAAPKKRKCPAPALAPCASRPAPASRLAVARGCVTAEHAAGSG